VADFIGYFIVAFVVSSVAMLLYENRHRLVQIWRVYGAGWRGYLRGLGIAFLTINLAIAAYAVSPEFLQWSWMALLPQSGNSAVMSPMRQGANAGGLIGLVIVLVFYAAILVAMPFITRKEEEIFRRGHHELRTMSLQSVKFGFMHLIVGVPLILCFVLSLTGFLLALRYRQAYRQALAGGANETDAVEAGLSASSSDHALTNFWLVTLVAAGALWVLIFPR